MSSDSDEDFFDASPAIGEDATALTASDAQLAHPGQDVSRPAMSATLLESRRHALQEPVPEIPARFLVAPNSPTRITQPTSHLRDASRPSTAHGTSSSRLDTADSRYQRQNDIGASRSHTRFTRDRLGADGLAQLERDTSSQGQMDVARRFRDKPNDLFLDVADSSSGSEREKVPGSYPERAPSRTSLASKRRSLPPDASFATLSELRASTGASGVPRPASRLRAGLLSSDPRRYAERFPSPGVNSSFQSDDTVSISGRLGTGRVRRFSNFQDQSPLSPSKLTDRVRSPEYSQFGRRRPSFGAGSSDFQQRDQGVQSGKMAAVQDESPVESSEPTVDSQTADTVWDELDDLKSRIKKLELTGKLPPTSSAAVSGDSSERPRTATTAPTTIDSSPKHERKAESNVSPQPPATENIVGGTAVADMHPMLHAALAKAKPLLNGTLYRTLEATAADALHLALMTGGAGPQGTTYSAASIINGATVPDRHVRRKADTMCRNLTDLCLALCEGKHESPSVTAAPSPVGTEMGWRSSPSTRYPRNSLGPSISSTTRPMSRLEARKTSMLGAQSIGRRPSNDGPSPSELDSPASLHDSQELRRTARMPSGIPRHRHAPTEGLSPGEEDATMRPPSRAMTDVNGLRSRLSGTKLPQRSPGSLRESLADMRRGNESAFDGNRDLSRVPSIDSRKRRAFDLPTSPVQEEDSSGDFQSLSQSRRRVTSAQQHTRRATTDILPGRVSSLNQRRRVIAE